MDQPPPYDGLWPWPNEKEPISEKVDAALLPSKPIAIKAICIFHLAHAAHTDSSGVKHPVSISKTKRTVLEFTSHTTLDQFFELARATFLKLFHCRGCCAPRTSSIPSASSSSNGTVHAANRQAAWEELKQDAARLTNSHAKRIITWTPEIWDAELQGAIALAADSKGKVTPVFKLTTWFFQRTPRKLKPEASRRVPLLTRLSCLAKGHHWRKG